MTLFPAVAPKHAAMSEFPEHLHEVGEVVRGLRGLDLDPVLVGGMALVILGSRRVTRDFDFVVAAPGDRLEQMLERLYEHGLELVARLDDTGEVVATIANRRVAAIRLRIDAPRSAYFFNAKTGLRVDLLFDFPVPAARLAEHATRTKVRGHVFAVASEPDLLRLKTIAQAARAAPGDADDIAFLKARRGRRRT